MKREFEMTEADYAALMEACKPVPYLVANGVVPESPRDRVMAVWLEMGERMGFDYETAAPSGKGQRVFLAVPKVVTP